ncbi:MFS transporter [Candidatus Micrarchaeota archaeon]|nr:MFS transporter [Candidatus Micrarchaeota archaeon]
MQSLSKNTKIFSLASFFVDISSEMIIWILPFFLSTVLAAPIFVIGLIDALRESVGKLVGIFAGVYADKTGKRKKLIIFGYSLSAAIKAFLIIATSWMHVLVVIFFERFGKGIRDAPRDAMIVISEKKENLGKAFGFRRMFDTFGAIIGPLIAMIILAFMLNINVENTYRFIFTVALIPAVLAVLILFFIKEESAKMQDEKKIIMSVLNAKNYKNFIFVSLIFAIGEFTIALFLLRAGEFVNILYIPLLGMIFNIFYAMFSVPAGHLTDRIGAKKSLIISWIIFMLAAIGFAFFASFQSVFILFAVLGLFTAMYKVAPSVYLSKVIPKEQYASATGLYQGIISLAVLPANLIASLLWSYGPTTVFAFPIATTVIAIIALNFLVKE